MEPYFEAVEENQIILVFRVLGLNELGLNRYTHEKLCQLIVEAIYRKKADKRIPIEARLYLLDGKLVHVLYLQSFKKLHESWPFWAVDDQAIWGVEFLREIWFLALVDEEEFLNPNQHIVVEEVVFGPFALVVYPKGTLVTKVLLAILTKFVGVVLLALLTDDFTWML